MRVEVVFATLMNLSPKMKSGFFEITKCEPVKFPGYTKDYVALIPGEGPWALLELYCLLHVQK